MPLTINAPDWINAAIATLALFRPWRLFRRAKLEVVLNETLGLSFNSQGARLMIRTTLRAINADSFVTRSEVVITHKKNGATQRLAWVQNATNTVDYQGNLQYGYLPATGFVVNKGLGFPFHAVFNQRDLSKHAVEQLRQLNKAWVSFMGSAEHQTITTKVVEPDKQRSELMLSFRSHNPVAQGTSNAFDEEFVWREGDYSLSLVLRTAEGKEFTASGDFTLDREEVQYLRANVEHVVESATGSTAPYRWVNVDLKDLNYPRA